MNSILITGGAGFIGSHFVKMLMARYPSLTVHVLDSLTYAGDMDNLTSTILDSDRFHFFDGNVCDSDLVGDLIAQVDTVVHFAAETHVARSLRDNRIFFETDVMGTHVVANQILNHRSRIKRFIHISTSEVYGTALHEPMTEDHPLNPLTPYASAKCGADRLVYSYWKTYDIPAVIVRPFNQYGPHQHLEKCIPRFITNGMTRKPLTIHGDGSAMRDWVYVEDTCDALLRVLEVPLDDILGEVINLGTGLAVSVGDIAHQTMKMLGVPRELCVHVADRPGQVDKHISSTDKAKRLLEWEATTNLEVGLDKTIAWYGVNEAWWQKREWMKNVEVEMRGDIVLTL